MTNGEITGNDDPKESVWDVLFSFSNQTISFFSNGYYIKEDFGKIKGYKYMEIWHYEHLGHDNYYFICENKKDYILSMEGILIKSEKQEENEIFQLIDIKDYNDDNIPLEKSVVSSSINLTDSANSIAINV